LQKKFSLGYSDGISFGYWKGLYPGPHGFSLGFAEGFSLGFFEGKSLRSLEAISLGTGEGFSSKKYY
jgi:hypothetical protein